MGKTKALNQDSIMDFASHHVGKSLDAFVENCNNLGLIVRVSEQDGEVFCGSCEYNPLRLNVSVKNKNVVEILGVM